MGFIENAKDVAETAGRKAKEAWEDTTDKIGDKIDEKKAEADVKKAEAERDQVKERNALKDDLRDN
ncbi:MAG: hypothetical protein PGN24_10240 [Microbacterium arborescens]